MVDKAEVRLSNLRKLVTEHEGMNNLARKLGMAKGAYISQLLMEDPPRPFTEKTARKWERKLNLPTGFFDGDRVGETTPLNAGLLTQALVAVNDALKNAKVTLQPAKVAELVTMQYNDALTTGRVDTQRLNGIVDLLKR